jgi:hypothetical protein
MAFGNPKPASNAAHCAQLPLIHRLLHVLLHDWQRERLIALPHQLLIS